MGAPGANPGPLFVGLQSATLPVIPAKAGTQTPTRKQRCFANSFSEVLGPGLRRDDGAELGPLRLMHQRRLDRDADRLGGVACAHLVEHVGAVDFDRARADLKPLADQAVR